MPAGAEAAGDHDAVEVGQAAGGQQPLDLLGLDPVDLDLGAVVEAGVLEALDDRQVGVGQLDVLADQPDPHRLGGRLDGSTTCSHGAEVEVGRRSSMRSTSQTTVVEALVVQDQRQLVDVAGVGGVDDGPRVDVAEVGDLALEVVADSGSSLRHTITSGWMPRLRSSVTECCVGLVFCSPDGPMNGTSVTWT